MNGRRASMNLTVTKQVRKCESVKVSCRTFSLSRFPTCPPTGGAL